MNIVSNDVVIVGGGIMGASAAFFLRQRGRSVSLLERELVGRQASGTNFGNVRRQGRPLWQLPLSNRASNVWRQSKELLGVDVEYLQSGHLTVCYRDRPEIVDRLEKYAQDAKHLDLELEVLTGAALRKRFPFLGSDVLAGSYSAQDGQANPRLAAPAFARAAKRAGANIFENTEIVSVEKDGEDFKVSSRDGRVFRAPVLLITAGAWGNHLSSQFGEPVPLTNFGPTMSVTEPVTYSILPAVGISTPDKAESVYIRQIPRGNIIIGGSTRGPSYLDKVRAYVLPQNTVTQLQKVQKLIPKMANLKIIRTWSGIEGYMPDNQPVLGPSEQISGLYYGFGFSGAGFQIGPGVGDTLAELIDTGTTEISLKEYGVTRYRDA